MLVDTTCTKHYTVFSGVDTAYMKQYVLFSGFDTLILCASFSVFLLFFASFLFQFLLFPSMSIDDMGATSGGFFFWIFLFPFLACF